MVNYVLKNTMIIHVLRQHPHQRKVTLCFLFALGKFVFHVNIYIYIFWLELGGSKTECPIAQAQTFDWDTLTRYGTGKPEVTFTIDVDESADTDLALHIEVTVPYIVTAKADDQMGYNFGTTYVLGMICIFIYIYTHWK